MARRRTGTKAGTPTMGGLLILTSALVPTLLWADLTNPFIWIAVLATVGFGAIGFADDYLKIVRRSHHGLLPRYKMGWQIVVAAGVGARAAAAGESQAAALQHAADLPVLQAADPRPRLVLRRCSPSFLLVGATNDVNLTDGLDGLAISVFAGRRGRVHRAGLRLDARRVLQLPAARAAQPRSRGADDLLRRARRREPRVPLVELLSGGDLHGRRRLARPRRRARHRRAAHQAGDSVRRGRRRVRHGSGCP